MTRFQRRRSDGQALVETAVAIPVLLALVWAIVGFGRIYSAQLVAVNACREGARLGALGKSEAAVRQAVNDYLVTAFVEAEHVVELSGLGGAQGELMTLTLRLKVRNPVTIPGLPAVVPLKTSSVMRIE